VFERPAPLTGVAPASRIGPAVAVVPSDPARALPLADPGQQTTRYVKVLDQTTCIGCHACTTACKSEHDVPVGVTRTYVKAVDVGAFPRVRRNFQVTRCNQCEDAPCVTVCPTAAMFTRDDGIVDFDKQVCIGCKACMAACPYDAIFINPEDHAAEKCNLCAHRIDMGLEPACVVVCPVEAILVGDINDPGSRVAAAVGRNPTAVRRPEKDTRPKVHYVGASQSTLDPLAARRPEVDIFAWAQQHPGSDPHRINSGTPVDPVAQRDGTGGPSTSSAAALLSYDIGHDVPWDWRVGLYTWTKSIAAGTYLVAVLLLATPAFGAGDVVWRWLVPVLSAAFLALTGAILVWDLEHPARFFSIFTRPQWRSWLVRGGVIIVAFGVVLAAHLAATLVGATGPPVALTVLGVPAALATAVYTAFLFAQAKARDLWQNPLLPPHFAVQAVLAGAAALLPLTAWRTPDAVAPTALVLAAATIVHLLMVAGEVTLTHPTAHARMAAHELVAGRVRTSFLAGVALCAFGLLAPWVGVVAAPPALVGLLLHEHAYVQAGQSVPLA
jgi:Fe-S-cluster-containing dehydrogenase component/formate-dependent nitrite reductase membrane component NrfD